jgi:hypothetical protein
MTHITDDQLAALALDEVEAGARGALEAHLEACAACRESLAQTRMTLDVAAAIDVPARGDGYGAEVWARLEPRLASGSAIARTGGTVPRRPGMHLLPWLAAAAALVLAAGAYWLGRHDAAPARAPEGATAAVTAPAPAAGAIRERVVLAALGEHFDRTERTLVELVNSTSDRRVDIAAEQAWARDLLEANRLYRQAASGSEHPAVSQVLEDLEPVLLEIANSPSRLTSQEFEALRDRIEARSLVFKVRVTGADVRARERALNLRPAQDGPSSSRGILRGESQS